MNLWCFHHEIGSWFEGHPEHRFCTMGSESVFLSTERVNLWCFHHEIGNWFEGHPEHRNITELRS